METLRFGDWKFTPKALSLRRGDYVARHEYKVIQTLYLLASHAPNVMTRETLLNTVWLNVVVGDNSLHRVISMLRKTLGHPTNADTQYIATVPRIGYRFVQPASRTGGAVDDTSSAFNADKQIDYRLPIGLHTGATGETARTQQLIRAITRYLIWRHPAFTILQQTDALDLAYKVQVNCAARSNKVTYEWDVFDAHTKELVQSGSRNHSAEGNALDTLEHIGEHTGEHIGERIANEILRHRRLGALQIYDPKDLSYADLILLGNHFVSVEQDQLSRQRHMLEVSVQRHPDLPIGHAMLSNQLSWAIANGLSLQPAEDKTQSLHHAAIALALDPNHPMVAGICGLSYSRLGEPSNGIHLCRQALSLAPSIYNKDCLAMVLCFDGQASEAIELYREIEAALPAGQVFNYGKLVVPYTQLGDLVSATQYANLATTHFPNDYFNWVLRANLLAQQGQLEQARSDLARAHDLYPQTDPEKLAQGIIRTYGAKSAQREWLIQGLLLLQSKR